MGLQLTDILNLGVLILMIGSSSTDGSPLPGILQRARREFPPPSSHKPPIGIQLLPGEPGRDYPVMATAPETSFRCVQHMPGYYADVEARCQVFHICQNDGRQDRFLCPNGTLFNQNFFVCDWWYNVNCANSPALYYLNKVFQHPDAPLVPKIEDYAKLGAAQPVAIELSPPEQEPEQTVLLTTDREQLPSVPVVEMRGMDVQESNKEEVRMTTAQPEVIEDQPGAVASAGLSIGEQLAVMPAVIEELQWTTDETPTESKKETAEPVFFIQPVSASTEYVPTTTTSTTPPPTESPAFIVTKTTVPPVESSTTLEELLPEPRMMMANIPDQDKGNPVTTPAPIPPPPTFPPPASTTTSEPETSSLQKADENSSSSNRTTPAANSYGNRKAKKFEFASFKRF